MAEHTARLLDSHEAAQWLADHGAPGTRLTLEKWRCYGRGPAYVRVARRIRYRVPDLEAFATGRRYTTTDCDDLAPRR